MLFFSFVFPRDVFHLLFWNVHFTNAQDKWKTEDLIKSVHPPLLIHFSVAVNEGTVSLKGRVSFKTYNPMKPVKFVLNMFVLSDRVCKLKSYTLFHTPLYIGSLVTGMR